MHTTYSEFFPHYCRPRWVIGQFGTFAPPLTTMTQIFGMLVRLGQVQRSTRDAVPRILCW